VADAARHPTPSGAWIQAELQESSTIRRFQSAVEIGRRRTRAKVGGESICREI
jgi:hypothetical protein